MENESKYLNFELRDQLFSRSILFLNIFDYGKFELVWVHYACQNIGLRSLIRTY